MVNRQHRDTRIDRNGRRRHRHPASSERHTHRPTPLTEEGFPAATPDAPKLTSPVVFVSDESRARHPWLPGRVIAGSVWRGPGQQRIRVDENGNAVPYRRGPATAA